VGDTFIAAVLPRNHGPRNSIPWVREPLATAAGVKASAAGSGFRPLCFATRNFCLGGSHHCGMAAAMPAHTHASRRNACVVRPIIRDESSAAQI